MSQDWAVELRAQGHRATSQRILVLEIIGDLRHATPDQVLAEAQRRGSAIDLSTVYRTLEMLNEAKMITHAHLGHGSPTYHPIDARPHIHLVCRTCEGVTAIDAGALEPMVRTVRGQSGFLVDIGHLALHGTCRDCQTATQSAAELSQRDPGLPDSALERVGEGEL